jgi:hypothetical protein
MSKETLNESVKQLLIDIQKGIKESESIDKLFVNI